MKAPASSPLFKRFSFLFLYLPSLVGLYAADQIDAQLRPNSGGVELNIRSTVALPVAAQYPEFTLLHSTNLMDWAVLPEVLAGEMGVSQGEYRWPVAPVGPQGFYRVSAQVKQATDSGSLGPAIYGYADEFARQRRSVGQMELTNFIATYGRTNPWLSALTFNPTNAEYWSNFVAAGYQLNAEELSLFQTNGFVVSQRLGQYGFPRLYYNLFTADLPVYISCDAVLQAWHRSYVGMLEEIEESYLAPRLETVMDGMAGQVFPLWSSAASTALADGVIDADYFLAVARSLLTGEPDAGAFGDADRVEATLLAISNRQPAMINLFGTNRAVDFSQFEVRGHYATSKRLARYFQASMWCALADFRITGRTNDNSLRELSGAVALHFLLRDSGQFANWKQLDDVVQMFVGPSDAMNFGQLSNLLAAANITTPAALPNAAALDALRLKLVTGQVGTQNIQSGYFWSPLSVQQIKLPHSFSVLPQRFTPDGWVMSQCVFDRILWDSNGVADLADKIMRRVPTAVDVAFAVLGNSDTVPWLAGRIADSNGVPWRDGYPYQHNLAAVRNVMDLQTAAAWTNNLYMSWLWALRGLSEPVIGPEYPDALRTPAWSMKNLNTQLASWTQLRHDTILYAKQPYTGQLLCSYPAGFVEPRVEFWNRMQLLVERSRTLLASLPATGTFIFEPNDPNNGAYSPPITNSLGAIYTNRLQFLSNFTAQLTTLKQISVKELNREPLSSNEVFFIQSLIENPTGYSGSPQYSGWYPTLFYVNTRAANSGMFSAVDAWDPLVVDVHTDPEDPLVGDPGAILHQAVGNADLLLISVNWGSGDACVYGGPVLSHYEFQLGPTTRRTDAQWKAQLKAGQAPPPSDWTRSYLIPGNISYPWWIQ